MSGWGVYHWWEDMGSSWCFSGESLVLKHTSNTTLCYRREVAQVIR